MDNDPIVEEVRASREANAAKFNFDLQAIYQDIKEKEAQSGRKYINFEPKPVEQEIFSEVS